MSITLTEQDIKIFELIQKKLNINLNEGQRMLVLPSGEQKLCSAVPGSGKTTALGLSVVCQELIGKTAGNRMYVMTFTNKATNEFKQRHSGYMEQLGLKSYVHVSTIHSMCKRYVEMFHERLGMMKAETQTEEDAIKSMQRVIAAVYDKDERQVSVTDASDYISCIGYLNNRLMYDQSEIQKTHAFIQMDVDYDKFNDIRTIYQSSQRRSGMLTFDEWMLAFYELLLKHDDIRETVQNQLDALFVDEFQDTTLLQFEIIRLMKGENTVLTAVGDQDQSIYRWRGASNVYGKFIEHFPNYQHIKLDINYRCPDFVVESANALIRNNTQRLAVTAKGTGKQGKLEIIPTKSNQHASTVIAQKIITEYKESKSDNFTLIDKLVLYRNHSQGMFLVYELATNHVPVLTSGVTLPHKDKIVRDLLEIIYFLANPRSSSHASKCMHMVSSQINKPKDKSKCPFNTSTEKEHFAKIPINVKRPDVYKKELEKLVNISNMLRENKPVVEIFAQLIPLYMDAYYKKFRINELMGITEEDVDSICNFLVRGINKTYDIEQFRYMLMQAEQFVNFSNKDQIGVKVYSVHSAKGLEAKEVYLLDVNNNIQPNRKTIDKLLENKAYDALEDYINEERSLFYVAETRTLRDLYVTYNEENPSPFNWESGLNHKQIAKKGVLTMDSLGVKKTPDGKYQTEQLVNKQMQRREDVIRSGGNTMPSNPTPAPRKKNGLDGRIPDSVLALLNDDAPKSKKSDSELLAEINQISNNLANETTELERRKMPTGRTSLEGVLVGE